MKHTSWRFVAAAVTGTGHRRRGQPCQDRFSHQLLANGDVAIVVVDGAGSASQADVAAEITVATATAAIRREHELWHDQIGILDEQAWNTVCQRVFVEARTALVSAATMSNVPVREYAVTLLVLIITADGIVSALIGDSNAVALLEDGDLITLCQPQKGEYANSAVFLTQEDAPESLEVRYVPHAAQGVVAMTDGLMPLAINLAHNRPFPPFFESLFKFADSAQDEQVALKQLHQFLDSDRVNARVDDDKTLVVAWKLFAA